MRKNVRMNDENEKKKVRMMKNSYDCMEMREKR